MCLNLGKQLNTLKYSYSEEVEQDYLELHRNTFFSEPNMITWSIQDIESKLHFPIRYYISHLQGLTTIQIDDHMIQDLVSGIHTYSLRKWKNYLMSSVVRSVLHHMRMLIPVDSKICISQVAEYFPLHICRRFKEHVVHPEIIDHTLELIQHEAREFVLRDNLFEFDNDTLKILKIESKKLTTIANHCALKQNNESMTHVESLFLNQKHTSYDDLIFELMANQQFQEKRFAAEEVYNRHLVSEYIEWNAWFEPDQNFIIIPPGILMAPSKLMIHGSYQSDLALRDIYLHEYSHTFSKLLKIPGIRISSTYEKWSRRIWDRYGQPSMNVHEENLADNYALYVGFNTWKHFKSEDDQRGYILTYVRMFCTQKKDVVTDHGSSHQRGTLPLEMLKNVIPRLFNCTF